VARHSQAILGRNRSPLFMAGAAWTLLDADGEEPWPVRRPAGTALEERTAELKVTQEELVKKERLATLGN